MADVCTCLQESTSIETVWSLFAPSSFSVYKVYDYSIYFCSTTLLVALRVSGVRFMSIWPVFTSFMPPRFTTVVWQELVAAAPGKMNSCTFCLEITLGEFKVLCAALSGLVNISMLCRSCEMLLKWLWRYCLLLHTLLSSSSRFWSWLMRKGES